MADPNADVRERIVTAIQDYLELIRPEGRRGDTTLAHLAQALDQLVSTYYAAPDVSPDTVDSCAPCIDQRPYEESAAAAFPDLGWYAVAEPEGDMDQKVGLTIATSDLAEIAADLINVLWLFENASENDAIFDFRLGYQTHWGRHAHELRVYLHTMGAW
jgi:hypothetical protein